MISSMCITMLLPLEIIPVLASMSATAFCEENLKIIVYPASYCKSASQVRGTGIRKKYMEEWVSRAFKRFI